MPTQSGLALTRPISQDRAMLTGGQVRAARALLRWTTRELADRSGVGIATIHRAEAADDVPGMNARTLMKIRGTLEAAGIVFLDTGDTRTGGPGVRLR